VTTPYIHHHLFEINDNLLAQEKYIGPYKYIVIDNFYKRADDIYDMLKESWVPNWKIKKDGRNFKDYFDCRTWISLQENGFENENKTTDYLKSLLKLDNHHCETIATNIFTWINPPEQKYQFVPHQDPSQNILVYMDKTCSGGTALYEKLPNYKTSGGEQEYEDIKIDIDEQNIKKHIIQSKFNRCVIFDGDIPHGGYIDNHKEYSNGNWRYNVVYFFDKWQN
jgi:hypothetical protein|tara:strand:+ start:2955 stop:3623 length:669 start_codon:yes stop_codon:yes gene_type:complete